MIEKQSKQVKGPVALSGIHSSGKSIAMVEGKNHYLDFGIPGEEVTFVSLRKNQGFRHGEVSTVITPSSFRTNDVCIHHKECNSCTWQHIQYHHQLELKYRILCTALDKYGIEVPEIPPVIPSPEIWHYRHRVEYTFSARAYSSPTNNSAALGFHRNGEPGNVIPIRECFLQKDPSRAICEFISDYADENNLTFYDHKEKVGLLRSLSIRINVKGEIMVLIGFNEERISESEMLLGSLMKKFPGIVSLNRTVHVSAESSQLQGEISTFGDTIPYIYEYSGKYRFRIHATSFYQPNSMQAEKIFTTISEWAELSGIEKVTDLYTGVGTIALYLAPQAGRVLGIEGSAQAIEDAKINAGLNGINNATFITGDILKTFTSDFLAKYGSPDVIVLDPPRSGTLIEIKKTINLSGARKVIYLSCNPVSLAFDLKQLSEQYRVVKIQPFDMLPQTHHLETLVMLEKKQ